MKFIVILAATLVVSSCSQTQKSAEPAEMNAETPSASAATAEMGTPATSTAGPQAGDTTVETIPGTDVTYTMVYIPGGTFLMGTPAGESNREEDEGPQQAVELAPFWISAYELTHDEFNVFRTRNRDSEATASAELTFDPDIQARPSPPYEDPAHGMGVQGHPAAGMTQWAAMHYANWLYQKTGEFYRLPTEAEWEYACRAGTTTAYSFGDDVASIDEYAWYWDNGDEEYHPVGQKNPNPWGLYDMHGNVAEWTLDEYRANYFTALLAESAVSPWAQPSKLHPRTVKGGAYDDDPEALRCGGRLESSLKWKRRDPQIPKSYWWNTDAPFVGFRLVRPVSPPSPEEIEEFWMINLGE